MEKKTNSSDPFIMRHAPLIFTVMTGVAFTAFLDLRSSNILSLVFFVLLYPFFKEAYKITDSKILVPAYICGLFYTLSFVFYKLQSPSFNYVEVYTLMECAIGFLIFFGSFNAMFFAKLEKTEFICADGEERKIGKFRLPPKTAVFFISMGVMLICWLPYFLQGFPGYRTNDSFAQLAQVTGNAPYSNHHPIAHTMMIKFFYTIGLTLSGGSHTAGVAAYTICQELLVAAAFAFVITTLYKFNVKTPVIAAALCYYAIMPFNGAFSVTIWKDVPFAAIVTVLSAVIWRLIRHYSSGEKKLPLTELIMLFIFGLGMCLFRSNGLYAYIILLPFLIIVFCRRSVLPVVISAAALALALLIKGPVYDSMGVIPSDTIESLSVPAQHIARALKDGAVLTDSEYELLSKAADVNKLAEKYDPIVSDPIKDYIREQGDQEYISEHKAEFLKLWAGIGLRYPQSYLLAQIDQTSGYWYPDVQFWVYPWENGLNYDQNPDTKLPYILNHALVLYSEAYERGVYLGLFWSIGAAVWLCLFMMFLCIAKKKGAYTLVYIPVLAVVFTLLIATPVFAEFRYAYSVFTTLPLLCAVPFCHGKNAAADSTAQNAG